MGLLSMRVVSYVCDYVVCKICKIIYIPMNYSKTIKLIVGNAGYVLDHIIAVLLSLRSLFHRPLFYWSN